MSFIFYHLLDIVPSAEMERTAQDIGIGLLKD